MTKKLLHTEYAIHKMALVRVYYDTDLEEFKCALTVAGKTVSEADYYTDDKNDALGTADQMLSDLPSRCTVVRGAK